MEKSDRVVEKPSDIEKFRLKEGEDSFDFSGVTFKCEMDFSGWVFTKAIFNRVLFKKNINLNKAQFSEDAYFTETQFPGMASFYKAQFSGNAYFDKAQFSGVAYFSEAQFSRVAYFIEAEFSGNAYFNKAEFSGSADFIEAQFLDEVYLGEAQFLENAYFIEAQFSGNAYFIKAQFSGSADFTEAQFSGNASFATAQFLGNTFFNNIEVKGKKMIRFYLTLFSKNVEFIDSKIIKSSFQSVLFEQPANFMGSDLTETDFVGSVFKEFGLFRNCNIEVANRETFRIVKHELLKLDNKIDALIYHKKEMRAYWKELWDGKWHKKIPEKFILFMNRISNGFGLNWIRGIGFTLITALIFFIPYLLCLKNPYYQWGWVDWQAFWEVSGQTVKYYVEFFYAAHKFDFMEQYQPKGFAYILDMVGRIFITYGYYQTIQAFRKYGRW